MAVKKTVITIRGPANSGKTTLAKTIVQKIRKGQNKSIMLLSQDYIRHEMLYTNETANVAPSIALMKNLTAYAIDNVDILVIEGILTVKHHEEFFKYLKNRYASECHSYYICLSLEETKHRYRIKSREEYEINCLDKWYIGADYSVSLKETVLDGRMTTGQMVKMMLCEMHYAVC